ncbi:MAG: metallophosphoesterase [Armatimonadota bacterium]|nr:metallophosphoesterase [Armatimonadota bacterium]
MAVYVIGDIHGHLDPLVRLVDSVNPGPEDVLVQLGDCINRGPQSFGVVEYWINFSRCPYFVLGGNHEEMMFDYLSEGAQLFTDLGGEATVESYQRNGWECKRGDPASVPPDHWQFYLQTFGWTRTIMVTSKYLFTHSGYDFGLDATKQNSHTIRWGRVFDWRPGLPTVVRGHTPHREVRIKPDVINVDTGCGLGGKLSCLELEIGRVWSQWP